MLRELILYNKYIYKPCLTEVMNLMNSLSLKKPQVSFGNPNFDPAAS